MIGKKPSAQTAVQDPIFDDSPPLPEAVVYLVGCSIKGRVKIGTSTDLTKRLATLRTHSPVPIELLWWTPGGRELERQLHTSLNRHRLHGEWFDFGDEDPVTSVRRALAELEWLEGGDPEPVDVVRTVVSSPSIVRTGPAIRVCDCLAWASAGPEDPTVAHRGERMTYDRMVPFALSLEEEQEGIGSGQDLRELAFVPAPPAVAERLGVEPGVEVWVRRSATSLNRRPHLLGDSYYRRETVEGTRIMDKDTGHGGVFRALEDQGHWLGQITEELTFRMPTWLEMDVLELTPGTPVIEMLRTAFAIDGSPVEVLHAVIAADLSILQYDFEIPD
jgi:hypothetical protein